MHLYQCHKKVRAGKIVKIMPTADAAANGVDIHIDDETTVAVTLAWVHKHQPEVGGYVVEYEDGYLSYSPAKAFEEGYTLIEE